MKKRLFFLAILWGLYVAGAKAQIFAGEEQWHEGAIYLKNGDTKKGRLFYHTENECVLVKESQAINTYNVRQIESFELVDITKSMFRWFYALPFEEKGKKKDMFFELLADAGNLTLLSREDWVTSRQPVGAQVAAWEMVTEKGEVYYLLNKDTFTIIPFPKTSKQLLSQMGEYKEAVEKFMDEQKLNLESRKDLIKIFYHYKSLQQKEESIPAI